MQCEEKDLVDVERWTANSLPKIPTWLGYPKKCYTRSFENGVEYVS